MEVINDGSPCYYQFQPTRPLRGATTVRLNSFNFLMKFQPTRPLRGATSDTGAIGSKAAISTHAPLAGRDHPSTAFLMSMRNFNPRAPCGARRTFGDVLCRLSGFQPTRPLRGATIAMEHRPEGGQISTHAPLAGRDDHPFIRIKIYHHFNPRAPCGARRL